MFSLSLDEYRLASELYPLSFSLKKFQSHAMQHDEISHAMQHDEN